MADTDLDLKTMQQVAACGYDPIERKGRGTYGFVYEVGDIDGNLFAFKYILPDPNQEQEGFDGLSEIDILSRVHHPYIIHTERIITTHDCEIDGMAVVLPLANRTLFDTIQDPLMTTDDKLPLLFKLVTALEFMHRSRILHLDIKGTNVVIRGNIPFFIDFGLSMVVDNTTVGAYNPALKVTSDHRPPEILVGGRIYNAAVDVWAFGIMMLYVLSGQGIFEVDFSTITDVKLSAYVINLFSDPTTISRLLEGVREERRPLIIDLLTRVLRIDPNQRLTAQEMYAHPLFDEYRTPVDGYLDNPKIGHNYAPDHRDILKLMIHWATMESLYLNSRAELLFLAVDLFVRVSPFYTTRETIQRLGLAATSLWMASKLVGNRIIPLDTYIAQLIKMVPTLTPKLILATEIEIIHLLSGILNVSSLYVACTTGDELKLSYSEIILSKDSTLYARTDIPAWVILMKQYIPNPEYKDKNILIKDL